MASIVDLLLTQIIWGLNVRKEWEIFNFSPQNFSPHSGVFVWFGSHGNANPHLRPEVGRVGAHIELRIRMRQYRILASRKLSL